MLLRVADAWPGGAPKADETGGVAAAAADVLGSAVMGGGKRGSCSVEEPPLAVPGCWARGDMDAFDEELGGIAGDLGVLVAAPRSPPM